MYLNSNVSLTTIRCSNVSQDQHYYLKRCEPTRIETINSHHGRDSEGESCYGDTTEDPYGDPVVQLTAKQVRGANLSGPEAAYVNAMDNDDLIALYWN